MERFSQGSESRYMGVSGNIYGGWVAKIRDVNLGTFDTEAKAALAYDDAAFRLRGRNAKLNFPYRSSKEELMSAMDFGSGVCVGADTGELPQSIAREENEELEFDWDAIMSQEGVAVGNQGIISRFPFHRMN